MGIKLTRVKEKNYFLSFFYLLNRIPIKKEFKLKLYLNLEWVFDRFSHELSFHVFPKEEHPLRIYTIQFILNWIKSGDIVLDLGCGNGVLSHAIAAKAKKVVGIDIDNASIVNAQNTFSKKNLFFICADAYEYLNKNKDTFDVLILSHILEHLDNTEEFINKYKKYFRFIYIELPDFDKSYMNHYRKALKMKLIYTDLDHVVEFDRFELYKIIETCNLEIIASEFRFGIQKIWCKVLP